MHIPQYASSVNLQHTKELKLIELQRQLQNKLWQKHIIPALRSVSLTTHQANALESEELGIGVNESQSTQLPLSTALIRDHNSRYEANLLEVNCIHHISHLPNLDRQKRQRKRLVLQCQRRLLPDHDHHPRHVLAHLSAETRRLRTWRFDAKNLGTLARLADGRGEDDDAAAPLVHDLQSLAAGAQQQQGRHRNEKRCEVGADFSSAEARHGNVDTEALRACPSKSLAI